MRVPRILTGVLLTSILLWPVAAAAQARPPTAISPYVQESLARADQGIANAWAIEAAMQFAGFAMPFWQRVVFSAVAGQVDTQYRVTGQGQSLLSDTACMRADELLLEMEMEKVRSEMKKAVQSQSASAILGLADVIPFLEARYEWVVNGGRNPTVVDYEWYMQRPFKNEPPTWCCSTQKGSSGGTCSQMPVAGCAAAQGSFFTSLQACSNYGCGLPPDDFAQEPLQCPFHSDYLPASTNGFGCDVQALKRVVDSFPADSPFGDSTKKELAALVVIQDAIDKTNLLGDNVGGVVNGGDPPKRVHVTQAGCILDGRCENEISVHCQSADQCESGGRCIDGLSAGVCENNQSQNCFDDNQCGGSHCRRLSDALQIELRGPFSLEKDQPRLLEAFQKLRGTQGESRPVPRYLTEEENKYPLLQLIAEKSREFLKLFSGDQGKKEAMTFAVGSDNAVQSSNATDLLNSSVADLGKLASSMTGMRGFVRDFAFFLRRSCTERPCNERLDRVLKIIFTDECFPYTSGKYLDDTEAQTRWQTCMSKAGIDPLN